MSIWTKITSYMKKVVEEPTTETEQLMIEFRPAARIEQDDNGLFVLYNEDGDAVATYSKLTSARRGAARRGIEI